MNDDYQPIATGLTRDKYTSALTIHQAEVPGVEANFVLALIEKWGLVAGAPDGEDSAGRAQMRLLTPEEVVTRAMATSRLAFGAFREAGWLVQTPLPLAEVEKATG